MIDMQSLDSDISLELFLLKCFIIKSFKLCDFLFVVKSSKARLASPLLF